MQHTARRFMLLGLVVALLLSLITPASAATPGGPGGPATVICQFHKGAFPESLAVDADGTMYVSLGFEGRVVRIVEVDGIQTYETYAQLNQGQGLITGLAFDKDGNLYVGVATFSTDPLPYIAKISPKGVWETFAVLPVGSFPNGLAFDTAGSLYVSDSHSTTLYKFSADGETRDIWLDSPLLAPNKGLGANGLAFDKAGDMWIAVSNSGMILQVHVSGGLPDGEPVVVKQGEELKTADGIAFGPDGSLYVAVNRTNSLWVLRNGSLARLANRSDGLSYPTQPVISGGELFLTNGALYNGTANLISLPLPTP